MRGKDQMRLNESQSSDIVYLIFPVWPNGPYCKQDGFGHKNVPKIPSYIYIYI